jgi:hypothetical protein
MRRKEEGEEFVVGNMRASNNCPEVYVGDLKDRII